MKPIVDELEVKYGNEIDFVYLNIDDPSTRDAQEQYNFRYQPHFVLLNADGEVVEQWVGYQSPNIFEEAFAGILSN